MEIIRIAGYTEEEKLEIAKRHLIEKVKSNNALTNKEFKISMKSFVLYDKIIQEKLV